MTQRLFVCGDIHGCYDELMSALDTVAFDFDKDHLHALGDLVDRGPRSADVLELLTQPWFDSIRGNHEQLLIDAHDRGEAGNHVMNRGGWYDILPNDTRRRYAELAHSLPIARTVTTPTGRRIGLVHADVPCRSWNEFLERQDTRQIAEYAMWSRETIRDAESAEPILGIDHVYMGHTPVKTPLRAANMSWIDTGCFATGILTIEELV